MDNSTETFFIPPEVVAKFQTCLIQSSDKNGDIHLPLLNTLIELYDKIDDPIMNKVGNLLRESKRSAEGDSSVDLAKIRDEFTSITRGLQSS